MKKLIIMALMVLLLTGCNQESTTPTKNPDNPDISKPEEVKEEVNIDVVIEKFKAFTESKLTNFELEVEITTTEINAQTQEENQVTVKAEIKAINQDSYYLDMTTYVADDSYGVEIYNLTEGDDTTIYMQATFGYPDWIKTSDPTITKKYSPNQFNNLILIPNGSYEFIEKKTIRRKEYYLISIEINDQLLQKLLDATNSTMNDLNIGKLTSHFYVDEEGIPYIIESSYFTSNSMLEIEMELTNVGLVETIEVPDKVLKNYKDIDNE